MQQKFSPEQQLSPQAEEIKGPKVVVTPAANDHYGGSQQEVSELRVCDIIGDWGPYQWSLVLFAVLCSALLSSTITLGPMWTPDMGHVCAHSRSRNDTIDEQQVFMVASGRPSVSVRQCALANQTHECESFIYDDERYGKLLTNSFDLVCGRKWLRSALSSSALTGMLLSSVTLGLLSDRYGRMSCIKIGFAISILATAAASLVRDYFLLNVCFMLMAYAQVGTANALSTAVLESTSPRWRFVPLFEYQFGWGLGMLLVPIINSITMNYRLYLAASLSFQLLLLIWLKFGAFESIRWLLSEGKINRAQIELQRACRINGIRQGTQLAQKIAQVQAQQLQKASCALEQRPAPESCLGQAKQQDPMDEAVKEPGQLLSAATIRRSFSVQSYAANSPEMDRRKSVSLVDKINKSIRSDCSASPSPSLSVSSLSPHLARKSFSLFGNGHAPPLPAKLELHSDTNNNDGSITSQELIQLALSCSNLVGRQEEAGFFIGRLFHRKLYKVSIILLLLGTMLETSYYGFIEAFKFVGTNVNENYIVGALSEWLAGGAYLLIMWFLSRRAAIILPVSVSALACLLLAINYHLIPDASVDGSSLGSSSFPATEKAKINGTSQHDEVTWDNSDHQQVIAFAIETAAKLVWAQEQQTMVNLREAINFWLVPVGKLAMSVGVLICVTICMESYPNNLRQTAPFTLLLVGRLGSILAPFLFNDPSEDKLTLKVTLVTLAAIGFIGCALVPLFLRNQTKNKELCDHLHEIEDT